MEPLTIFASSVGFIGALHLVFQTVERFGKGNNNRNIQSNKRADWYCFFKLSDLLGPEENTTTQQATLSEKEHLERIRKHQANRPRLHP